jgi:hypothetical protein
VSVLKAALRAVHGREKVHKEVSGYYMAMEWSAVDAGQGQRIKNKPLSVVLHP